MNRPRSALRAFLHSEAAGGGVLMAAALAALVLANSPLAADYATWLHHATGPVLAPAIGPMTVELWINDGLMALFFLMVGCEIKRELVDGELADPADRRLPIVAAAAGMAAPALIFLGVTRHPGLARGWAIPAATDIAFAIGVMALLGKRVPAALKLFLTTVAIVDDMGAVAIIAVAYSHGLDWAALAAAAGTLALLAVLNRRGVTALTPYLVLAALLWWLVLRSGVHATVSGVLAALFVPVARSPGTPEPCPERLPPAGSRRVNSPLHRLEHALNPWVAFLIVPLFGLANAGVSLARADFTEPLVLGIAAGLFVGKQLGILGAVMLAERLGFARRPHGVSWTQLHGVALLAGIGFTMSLFIGGLAFPASPVLTDAVKVGVLLGSLLSGAAGYAVLRWAGKR